MTIGNNGNVPPSPPPRPKKRIQHNKDTDNKENNGTPTKPDIPPALPPKPPHLSNQGTPLTERAVSKKDSDDSSVETKQPVPLTRRGAIKKEVTKAFLRSLRQTLPKHQKDSPNLTNKQLQYI